MPDELHATTLRGYNGVTARLCVKATRVLAVPVALNAGERLLQQLRAGRPSHLPAAPAGAGAHC